MLAAERFYYYWNILLLLLSSCGCWGLAPCLCRWRVKTEKVVRSTLLLQPGQACLSPFTPSLFPPSSLVGVTLPARSGLQVDRGDITWRRAWCPGRPLAGGGSRSRCSASASPRTSWRWRRRRTPYGRTCLETGNGTGEYLKKTDQAFPFYNDAGSEKRAFGTSFFTSLFIYTWFFKKKRKSGRCNLVLFA